MTRGKKQNSIKNKLEFGGKKRTVGLSGVRKWALVFFVVCSQFHYFNLWLESNCKLSHKNVVRLFSCDYNWPPPDMV